VVEEPRGSSSERFLGSLWTTARSPKGSFAKGGAPQYAPQFLPSKYAGGVGSGPSSFYSGADEEAGSGGGWHQ
jgi:hypothetical protein